CLTTVAAFGRQGVPLAITVVDNASSGGAVRRLRDGLPMVEGCFSEPPRLITLATNTGFGPAANVGLRAWLDRPGSGEWAVVDPLMERNTLLLVRKHFGRYAAAVRFTTSVVQLAAGITRPRRRPWVFSAEARRRALLDHLRHRYGPAPKELSGGADLATGPG